jgi:WS/DGAT/MGAT family acyltransferase
MTDRLTPQDAVFFLLEGRTTPYHIGGLLLLDGPAPTEDEVIGALAERIGRLPRFRRRLQRWPLGLGGEWVEDEDLDLSYHVRTTMLPSPGTEDQLRRHVALLMATHLNRHRPLWELWLIDRPGGVGSAALLKAHHALIDGVTAAHDIEVLLGELEEATDGSVVRPARDLLGPIRRIPSIARGLAATVPVLLTPAPRAPFNRAIGPNRDFAYATAPLDDLKEINSVLGGTVNDVVLTAVTSGLRRWLSENGGSGIREIRALMPVSLRGRDDGGTEGNRVTGVIVSLPVGEPDPVRRLVKIRSTTHGDALIRQGTGNAILLQLPALIPEPMGRFLSGIQRYQRYFNISLPNIRGPEQPLYLSGHRITSMIPIPPLSANAGLIICALSYAGEMSFGMLSDPTLCPGLETIAEGIEKSIIDLREVVT